MEEIAGLAVSVAFIGIGALVAGLMKVMDQIGKALWNLKKPKLRKVMKALHFATPWLPGLFGGALGFIPWWPRPELIANLPADQQLWAMVVLGIVAGSAYERIWKGLRQAAETRGINLDREEPPSRQ